jgi:hypothetical protein
MPEIDAYQLQQLQRDAAAYNDSRRTTRFVIKCVIAVTVAALALFFLFRLVSPQLNLYKANTEKQARIAESRSKAEAAKFESVAEVERAKGAAEANRIIAESLDEAYLRYLYIQNLDVAGASVIYVPTEAGLPILEAGRTTTPITTP